ncbi:hypothetical protein Q9251_21725 [Alkalihalobacillus macyae]|uniref:hypothetical protein n=1 Tax=Guptibacillus hwajinpoensis TaxID=208199 RepID=UPI00273C4B69|nr:hypothetical protein [Alkalihalobacillus macyae]MDP4553476.1 hypothetical protein [Alkalihalobacillus macyae]
MGKVMIIVALLFSCLLVSHEVKAKFDVPTVKETNHWKIELLEPDKNVLQSEPGKFELYALKVTNKENNAYNMSLDVFRNENGSNKMYGLAPQIRNKEVKKDDTFKFENLPIKADTEKLEIVITWEDEPVGRRYKETFLLNP